MPHIVYCKIYTNLSLLTIYQFQMPAIVVALGFIEFIIIGPLNFLAKILTIVSFPANYLILRGFHW